MAQLGLLLLVMLGSVSTQMPSLQLLMAFIQPDILPVEMARLMQLVLMLLVQSLQVAMLSKRSVTVCISLAIENFSMALPLPKMQTSRRVKMFCVQAYPSLSQATRTVSIEWKQSQKLQLIDPSDSRQKVTMMTPMQDSPQIVQPRCTIFRQLSSSNMCVETTPSRMSRLPARAIPKTA